MNFLIPDKKLTDNDIVKAFEDCNLENATLYLYNEKDEKVVCIPTIEIFDLINRQKAEIERLEATVDSFNDIGKLYSEIKSEAYREFAERLKIRSHTIKTADGIVVECTPLDYIDRILKELVGEDDE